MFLLKQVSFVLKQNKTLFKYINTVICPFLSSCSWF